MAKEKKRLSKTAKAARKILEYSKLLATAKIINELKDEQTFNQTDSQIKISGANKLRPDKKRG